MIHMAKLWGKNAGLFYIEQLVLCVLIIEKLQ